MKFKYTVMWFDMPEYATGNCDTVEDFATPEEAYKKRDELDADNINENVFYAVVVFQDT